MARAVDLRDARSAARRAAGKADSGVLNIHHDSASSLMLKDVELKTRAHELHQLKNKLERGDLGATMAMEEEEPKNQVEYLEREVARRDGMISDYKEAIIDLKLELLNLYRRLNERG